MFGSLNTDTEKYRQNKDFTSSQSTIKIEDSSVENFDDFFGQKNRFVPYDENEAENFGKQLMADLKSGKYKNRLDKNVYIQN